MGRLGKWTIVKLGGSLITNKEEPLTPAMTNIRAVASAIAASCAARPNIRLFLIHGGGSFGHYYAKKFGLSAQRPKIDSEGISKTASAMIELHSRVLNQLISKGVHAKSLLTSEFLLGNGRSLTRNGNEKIELLYENGLVPITFGNVSLTRRGGLIISGDQIALTLTEESSVERVIFAMDVDGIYPDSKMSSPIIDSLNETQDIRTNRREYDVTGGIQSKISIGFKIAKLGADVFYINGTKPQRIVQLLAGAKNVKATKIYSKSI